MNRTVRSLAPLAMALLVATAPCARAAFTVVWGTGWDGHSLQEVLDAEYGVGAVNQSTDYEGAEPGDLDPPYWLDASLNGWVVRKLAGHGETNIMGWYEDGCCRPSWDELAGNVIFQGLVAPGATVQIVFESGATRFGFFLNPNGTDDADNAPEPELFFTNRFFNDAGPAGFGTLHDPTDGDPQCLVYNVTRLREGVPTFVLAWEDLDSGGEVVPHYQPDTTDNDFQDLVVEISAASPMPTAQTTWGHVKALFESER